MNTNTAAADARLTGIHARERASSLRLEAVLGDVSPKKLRRKFLRGGRHAAAAREIARIMWWRAIDRREPVEPWAAVTMLP